MFAYYHHNLSPFLIHFQGNWGIRYYGLAYALGFLGFYFGVQWQSKRGWCRLKGEAINNFFTMMLVGVIVGGRLGYCLLYDWQRTVNNPFSIIDITHGGVSGMASHGGILGAIAAIWFCARTYKLPFYNVADAAALCCPPALCLGRIANFINGELWGRPATAPWAVIFPQAPWINGVNVPRHPSQLYEALLEGLLLFLILLFIRFKAKRDGVVALTFMAGYAAMRIIGEFFREPDLDIGYYWNWATQGQLLSAGMFILTLGLIWLQFGRRKA